MSRLIKYRRKRFFIQFFIFLIGIIVFFFFLITVGIDLFVNITLFISNRATPKVENNYIEPKRILLETPTSSDIPIATNTAELAFTIRATRDAILTIDVNGDRIDKQTVSADEIPVVAPLIKGENTIVLQSYFESDLKTKKTQSYKINYINEKPYLEVTSPPDNCTLQSPNTFIEGKTDKQIIIQINSQPVIVTASETFKHGIVLKEGENKFIITATDQAGNVEEKTLTLRYEKSD